jgi:hypothetical protein
MLYPSSHYQYNYYHIYLYKAENSYVKSIKKPWNKNSMALDLVLSQVKDINIQSLI